MSRPDPVVGYRAALGGRTVREFPIHGLDRLEVPVWTTATWLEGDLLCNGVGYGFDDDAARRSAWGELAESFLAHEALARAEPVRGSWAELVARHGDDAVLDPRRAVLPADSSWTPELERLWVPALDSSGDEVLVLLELVATRPADLPEGYAPVLTPITNGLGAGPDRAFARAHGIGELLQRDGNSVRYRALDRGVAIDLDGLEDPVARALLERYAEAGVDVTVKLAGESCGVASVYVVGRDRDLARVPHPVALAACGEAAHPRREVAVRKALLEFAAARSRRIFNHAPLERLEGVVPANYLDEVRRRGAGAEEDRALAATRGWAHRSASETLAGLERIHHVREWVALATLPDADGVDLAALAFEPLWVPFEPAGAAEDACVAGKAIVPGLEVESLSYGRVGPRNLDRLVAAGVAWAGHGPPPDGDATPLPLAPGERAGWLDLPAMDAAVGDLYALYREPARHAVALADLATSGAAR